MLPTSSVLYIPISRAFGYPVPALHMYTVQYTPEPEPEPEFFLTRWRACMHACMYMQVCLCVFSAGRQVMQDVSLGINMQA